MRERESVSPPDGFIVFDTSGKELAVFPGKRGLIDVPPPPPRGKASATGEEETKWASSRDRGTSKPRTRKSDVVTEGRNGGAPRHRSSGSDVTGTRDVASIGKDKPIIKKRFGRL